MKNVHRVGLVDIIYVWNSVTCFRDSGERLEQLLFADCGDEFLEIERFEVRYVFESFFFVCSHGWLEHCRCFWIALDEVCVRMFYHICALACAVADEQAWTLLQIFSKAGFIDDGWSCFCDLTCVIAGLTGNLKHCCIYFHAACVYHWDDVAEVIWGFRLSNEGVEGADREERLARSEAEALGGGYAHAQTCV